VCAPPPKFGDCFAYMYGDVQHDKSNWGEQNGQGNLEEVEEAGSDEAVDCNIRRPLVTLDNGRDFCWQERADGHDAT
jgi:hypothetical protein